MSHLVDHVQDRRDFRDEQCWFYRFPYRCRLAVDMATPQLACGNDSYNVIGISFTDRVELVRGFRHDPDIGFFRLREIQKLDLVARSHQLTGATVADAEHPCHHHLFGFLEHARFSTPFNEQFDFLFGNFRLSGWLDADQSQHGIPGMRQEGHDRS